MLSCFRVFVGSVPVLALTACRVSMSPVQNRLAPGQEPFAVFVATGEAGVGDLFAVRADGGTTFPITYTRVREMAPALSPLGTDVAFIREGVRDDRSSRRVVVMNLLNGGGTGDPGGRRSAGRRRVERRRLHALHSCRRCHPRGGGTAGGARYPDPRPQPRPAGPIRRSRCFVGTPAFARVIDCPEGGVCVEQRRRRPESLLGGRPGPRPMGE